MCIIAFSTNCTGSLALKSRRERPAPPCPATGRMGEACQRDAPAKLTGQAGRIATRNVVRLSLVQREYVPACMLSRTRPDPIASWNAVGTLGRLDWIRAARTLCPGLSMNLGDS